MTQNWRGFHQSPLLTVLEQSFIYTTQKKQQKGGIYLFFAVSLISEVGTVTEIKFKMSCMVHQKKAIIF